MREVLPGHEVVGLQDGLQVTRVDATGGTHEQVLWPLHNFAWRAHHSCGVKAVGAKDDRHNNCVHISPKMEDLKHQYAKMPFTFSK